MAQSTRLFDQVCYMERLASRSYLSLGAGASKRGVCVEGRRCYSVLLSGLPRYAFWHYHTIISEANS
jgi:hypothetical protein